MAQSKSLLLQNPHLRLEVDNRDLAVHVTVKATGETFRMAGAQPDDVMTTRAGPAQWRSFTDSPVTIARRGPAGIQARLPRLNLLVRVTLEGAEVLFEVAPASGKGEPACREVLYPRQFILPQTAQAYATFPFGQGSIIPGDWKHRFHHREGYAEGVAHWLGGYTGRTGYVGIAETPDDLYQAVDHRPGSAASVFFHWLGSLGALRYPRRARYHFAKGLDYVAQAKRYRDHCRQAGMFRTLRDKARENPNVKRLIGAPIVCAGACFRRERSYQYEAHKFTDLAAAAERFRSRTGIVNAVVHLDGWGYWGYDAMHPDALPPNDDCGGAKGLSELARRVKAVGYLFGLHDQYIDFYAHAPSFDESLSIRLEDGTPVRVNRWCGGLCGHLCYQHIPRFLNRNLFEGVRRVYPIYHNSLPIWQICRPTAYYLDCFCRTVECWSDEHPMTRTDARRLQNQCFQITRNGAEGEGIVLSVEHPRDFAVPYLDFGWGIGHLMTDVPTTTGEYATESVGLPVPLWQLVFHDALCLPSAAPDLLEALLYGQAPYFWLTREPIAPGEIRRKKLLLSLHEDVAFEEMTAHEILSCDGKAQRTTFAGGIEVEVDKSKGTCRIKGGKARTKGTSRLIAPRA